MQSQQTGIHNIIYNFFPNSDKIRSMEEINVCNRSEKREEFYESGSTESVSYWFHNIPVYTHFYFHENQNLKSQIKYMWGKKHGNIKEYYETGQLRFAGIYKYGLKNGIQKEFYESGKIKKINYFKKGLPIYKETKFFENDKKKTIVYFNNYHKMSGYKKKFYESGNLKTIVFYQDGKKNGEYYEYYDNGIIKVFREYKDDQIYHSEYTYYENGCLLSIVPYEDDKKNGVAEYFDEKRRPIQSITFQDDKKNGLLKLYHEGKKIFSFSFLDDKMESFQYKFNLRGFHDKKIYAIKNQLVLQNSKEFDTCCVCYEMTSWKTKCNHRICLSCTKSCFHNVQEIRCPYCRQSFPSVSESEDFISIF